MEVCILPIVNNLLHSFVALCKLLGNIYFHAMFITVYCESDPHRKRQAHYGAGLKQEGSLKCLNCAVHRNCSKADSESMQCLGAISMR